MNTLLQGAVVFIVTAIFGGLIFLAVHIVIDEFFPPHEHKEWWMWTPKKKKGA